MSLDHEHKLGPRVVTVLSNRQNVDRGRNAFQNPDDYQWRRGRFPIAFHRHPSDIFVYGGMDG